MSRGTLLDIAKMNGSDGVVGLIEEAIKAHPELQFGDARTIRGTQYKTLVRVANPVVGFREANKGSASVKSTYENRLVETFIMNPRFEVDKAVADAHEDGHEVLLALEGLGMTEASLQTVCRQFYYGRGTGGDGKGFPGLLAALDTTNMVVDAGGTTDSTASSVWAVKFGVKDVQWVWGQDGELKVSDPRVETIYDDENNPLTAYVQDLMAYPGLQVGSVHSIGRIKKLTEDANKGLTDDLISKLLEKFPVGVRPDVLLMSRRSLGQLRDSRTATNATGAPAPFPTEAFQIPIHATDSILNTEALAL